ncbi:hypothetical protein Tco_0943968 [Tanacetum coccineum]
MAPEFWCQTNATEFWCHSISGAKLPFADVAPLFEFGTTTPSALIVFLKMSPYDRCLWNVRVVGAKNFAIQLVRTVSEDDIILGKHCSAIEGEETKSTRRDPKRRRRIGPCLAEILAQVL